MLMLGCTFEGADMPTPTPTAAEDLGLEIAETYGQLMLHLRLQLEPRPPAPEMRERLRVLREEYTVRFGNYACLRDSMAEADQAQVAETADENRERFLPEDMSWLEDAADDYDFEDTAIRGVLKEIEGLDAYAFSERLEALRPGETVVCAG